MVLRQLLALVERLPGVLQHLIRAALAAGTQAGPRNALLALNVVLLSISARRLQRARFAASVRVVQQLDREGLAYLLNQQLPMWIKFADWERGAFLQSFITLAWPTFSRMVCSIIKKEVEERLGSHGEFGRASFQRLSLGNKPPAVLAVKGIPLQDGHGGEDMLAMVIDIQIKWEGEPDVLMQLSGIPGAAVAVRTCQVEGMLRVVLSPIEEELPFLTGLTLSILERPHLDFDIRVLGGDVMSLPALGSWLRSAVAGIIQERLVWPECLGWRWGPSWDRQQAAATADGGRALLASEQQRRRQLPPPLGVLLVEVVGAELEPRRSTFLGRLKPVSSRVSLLLPAGASPGASTSRLGEASGGAGGGESSSASAARAVLQKGLTSVQAVTCKPLWQQTFSFVVSSRHQVLHLLLSHKRSGVLAKGVVQALGADMPLGSADVAVADILAEAAAQEEWTVQQMLLEAAKQEVARAAAQAAAAAATAEGSDADSMAGYESADDGSFSLPPSPASSRGSLGLGFASSAVTAAVGEDEELNSGSARGWVRLERRTASVSIPAPSAAAIRQQQWQQQRQATPPPHLLAQALERRSGGSHGSGGAAAGSPGRSMGQWAQQQQQHRRQSAVATPPPARSRSWRRGSTRSPSPDRRGFEGSGPGFLDPAALMQLQMEQRKPDFKWLSEEGVWVDVASANVLTLAGLLAQAAEPTAGSADAGTESPRSEASEEDSGWLARLQRYILGRGEGEDDADEFIPTQAPLAGKLRLRLTWQPVEQEPLPATLLLSQPDAQQDSASDPQQVQQAQQLGDPAAVQQRGAGGSASMADVSARGSLQIQRDASASDAHSARLDGNHAGTAAGGANASLEPSLNPGSSLADGVAAAAVAAAAAAAAAAVPQQGVLAVRVAHTKLEYVMELSSPVLAVSIDRRPPPDPASAAAPPARTPLGASPPRSALNSAAASPTGAAAHSRSAAASSGSGLASLPFGPPVGAPPLGGGSGAELADGEGQQAQQAPPQRWISMEGTPGSRMGSLHWGQVFYIPTALSELDCQAGRVVVELGEAASATRLALFGPALYSLDATDSFAEDVKVTAAAGVPLKHLLQRRRLSGKWKLKEAAAGVADVDRLALGEAAVQLAWFPLQPPPQAPVAQAGKGVEAPSPPGV